MLFQFSPEEKDRSVWESVQSLPLRQRVSVLYGYFRGHITYEQVRKEIEELESPLQDEESQPGTVRSNESRVKEKQRKDPKEGVVANLFEFVDPEDFEGIPAESRSLPDFFDLSNLSVTELEAGIAGGSVLGEHSSTQLPVYFDLSNLDVGEVTRIVEIEKMFINLQSAFISLQKEFTELRQKTQEVTQQEEVHRINIANQRQLIRGRARYFWVSLGVIAIVLAFAISMWIVHVIGVREFSDTALLGLVTSIIAAVISIAVLVARYYHPQPPNPE